MTYPYSFSALNTYLTCPRQYEGAYITRKFRSEETDATRWGNRVHEQLEAHLNGGPAPEVKPTDELLTTLRLLRAVPEVPLAVTAEWTPTKWEAPDCRLRGRLDVVVARPGEVWVVDWKTGKKRDNSLQAAVYSALLSSHFPGCTIDIVFDYLDKGRNPPIRGSLKDVDRVSTLMETIDDDRIFAPKPSGLCRGWCPVKDCDYWREKR